MMDFKFAVIDYVLLSSGSATMFVVVMTFLFG